jgi:DNA-binding transcriptional MerR regulator
MLGTISMNSLWLEASFMSNGRMRDETLGIGEAAHLFGLEPSTLRWWERCGLLSPRRGADGRRRYGEAELNRIALVHLTRRSGRLSLAEIADFAGGPTASGDRPRWHGTVRSRVALVEEQIAQLTSARAYLLHLLECRRDDPVQCPVFTRRVRKLYPLPWQVVAAAECDETEEAPSGEARCRTCGGPLGQPQTGRRRAYCSRACRQRAYRARRGPSPTRPDRGDPE